MPIRELISSYGQPIIMGLTPYTKTSIVTPDLREDWPPLHESERLARYEEFEALIENRPADVFEDLRPTGDEESKIVIAAALPELLCNVWADAVWADPPQLEFRSTQLDDRWQEIDTANDFGEIAGWESVFSAAAWGHSVLTLRRDAERLDRFDTDVVIEEINPSIYFPVLKHGSSRELDYVVLAWEEDRADPDSDRSELWQIREQHYVEAEQYRIIRQERKRAGVFSRSDWRTVKEEAPDGVSFLPFVDMHAKRWRGRYWGISELSRVATIVDEIDNTLSNIAEILEYHGSPMLQVPASAIFGGDFIKGADKTLGIRRAEEANIAKYITYDGQIDSQIADLDKLLELAFLTSEIPRTYFGLGENMAAPSGVSLKLQLQNYLKKAGRWQRAETLRLRALAPLALMLDGKVGGQKYADLIPKVTHGSPLPADDEQEARIEQGLFGAGMSSLELSLRKLRRVPADEVEDEIARIEAEKAASVAALPAPLRNNAQPPNSSTDPNAGDEPPA